MIKHFVHYLFPGSFVSEEIKKEVKSWDIEEANKNAEKGCYGFYFTTRKRGELDLDSKQIKKSGTYFIDGKIKTLTDVVNEFNPANNILISNMKINKWDRVVITKNGWTQPLDKNDVIIQGV